MDKLDALRVYCAVVETGGFSRAAEKLGISTSSVTAQVNALEAHFRVKLMNRTTRSMSLTGEGRECYGHAQRLLDPGSQRCLVDISGQGAQDVAHHRRPSRRGSVDQ